MEERQQPSRYYVTLTVGIHRFSIGDRGENSPEARSSKR